MQLRHGRWYRTLSVSYLIAAWQLGFPEAAVRARLDGHIRTGRSPRGSLMSHMRTRTRFRGSSTTDRGEDGAIALSSQCQVQAMAVPTRTIPMPTSSRAVYVSSK